MKYNWLTKTVGELTSYMAKGIPPKYAENISETTIYVLNQKCNRDYRISYEPSRLHDTSIKKVADDKMLKAGDVLINSTGTGTAGRVAQLLDDNKPTTVDGHMIIMRSTDEIDSLYYGYALKLYQSEIESFAEGSTGQTEINKCRLADEITITYPDDIEAQKYIASILRSLDEKIELNNAINNNLADMLQTIYQQNFNSSEQANNQRSVLSNICSYSTEKISVASLNLSNYYSTENMLPEKAGAVSASSLPSMTQTTKCKVGDVLISNIRPYFKKIVYCQSECGCSTDVLCFTPKRPELSAYVYSTLYADGFFNYMVAGSKGTKMPRGDKQQIMSYPVYVPTDIELESFNQLAEPVLSQIERNRLENINLVTLRNSLLPKLISGELDVSDIQL